MRILLQYSKCRINRGIKVGNIPKGHAKKCPKAKTLQQERFRRVETFSQMVITTFSKAPAMKTAGESTKTPGQPGSDQGGPMDHLKG